VVKHTIGWLAGDGIGIEVLAAARVVLDRLGLDAEYRSGDTGWGTLAAGRGRVPTKNGRPLG
jgi:isocitrate/isopropylmalate dehydrogenase